MTVSRSEYSCTPAVSNLLCMPRHHFQSVVHNLYLPPLDQALDHFVMQTALDALLE